MENIDIQIVEYDSPLQKKSVELRTKVLREPLGLVYTPEQLAAEKDEVHIIALSGDKVVGVLLLKIADKDLLKMRQVAVDTDCQQSGIGTLLVFFSEQYAKNNGFHIIELHARDAAKDFYLKQNYKVEGDMFAEVGIPHYKMKKKLE
ncbi:MAG: GNAT family N-acetyltransferase [Chitinophagales bacterium]|nr:GNAT family N-acetyltransferase [Chitinophagales bacterium]